MTSTLHDVAFSADEVFAHLTRTAALTDPRSALLAHAVATSDQVLLGALDSAEQLSAMLCDVDGTVTETAVVHRLAELLTPQEWLSGPSYYLQYVQRHSAAAQVHRWDPYSQPCVAATVLAAAEHQRLFRWSDANKERALCWLESAADPTGEGPLSDVDESVSRSVSSLLAAAVANETDTARLARIAKIAVGLDVVGAHAASTLRKVAQSSPASFAAAVTDAKLAAGTPVGMDLLDMLDATHRVCAFRVVAAVADGSIAVTDDVTANIGYAWARRGPLRGLWAAMSRPSARQLSDEIARLDYDDPSPASLLWFCFAPPSPARRRVLCDMFANHADRPTMPWLSAEMLTFFDDDTVVAAAAYLCDPREVTELLQARPRLASVLFAQALDGAGCPAPALWDAAAANLFDTSERAMLAAQHSALTGPAYALCDVDDPEVTWYVTYRLAGNTKAWQLFAQLVRDGSELSVMDLLDVATVV